MPVGVCLVLRQKRPRWLGRVRGTTRWAGRTHGQARGVETETKRKAGTWWTARGGGQRASRSSARRSEVRWDARESRVKRKARSLGA